MANYQNSKPALGEDRQGTVDSAWKRAEPLITAVQLRQQHLFGIPLESRLTKEKMSDEMLNDYIRRAVTLVEEETGITIMPTQVEERLPFDRNEYLAMGYFKLSNRPVTSIESLSVVTSNMQNVWQVANDWIDPGYMEKGLIYIMPINVANAVTASSAGSQGGAGVGGAAFLALMGIRGPWVPAYWLCKYTTGFLNGELPTGINELIGCVAAIDILNRLAAINAKAGSHSIGVDGLSQSQSNPGPDIYKTAIEELQKKKDMLVAKTKSKYGRKVFAGQI